MRDKHVRAMEKILELLDNPEARKVLEEKGEIIFHQSSGCSPHAAVYDDPVQSYFDHDGLIVKQGSYVLNYVKYEKGPVALAAALPRSFKKRADRHEGKSILLEIVKREFEFLKEGGYTRKPDIVYCV